MSDTMSGYLVKIEVFIPADPEAPNSMMAAVEMLRMLREHSIGVADFADGYVPVPVTMISKPRWLARRKSPASTLTDDGQLPSDVQYGLSAQVPASENTTQAQEGAGGAGQTASPVPDAAAPITCKHPVKDAKPCGGYWATVGAEAIQMCATVGCPCTPVAQPATDMQTFLQRSGPPR